ncbi:unnamed protein product [Schistosoma mattheei]|uniref:Uncharacterized protein n=1 Tax=Schistosoma mattheei TaxID=31246 RepID=A0A183P940_9TREM|nr:unnamed protein product [Schistosoma mattheei]
MTTTTNNNKTHPHTHPAQTSYDHSYQSDELLTEEEFRWQMNEDEMANDKLTDGIRRFTNDALILKDLIKTRIEQQ